MLDVEHVPGKAASRHDNRVNSFSIVREAVFSGLEVLAGFGFRVLCFWLGF